MNKSKLGSLLLISVLLSSSAQADCPKPRNEIDFYWDSAYISDLQTYWNFASVAYYRFFDFGKFGLFANRANKFGEAANQFGIEVDPIICNWIHVNASAARSSATQIIFPSSNFYVEAYFNNKYEEISLGTMGSYYKAFSNQNILGYTTSAGIYIGNYYPWFRFNTYNIKKTNYAELGLRRYFSDKDNYISLSINAGHLPDIGNLPPLDQLIVQRQKAINLDGQFRFMKNTYLRWHLGYANQMYPNNHLRIVKDAALELLWRF